MQYPVSGSSATLNSSPTRRQANRQPHAEWRFGLLFGALGGLFALLQVVVSVTSAWENHAALASIYYGGQNQALDPILAAQWLVPVLSATYGSCLLAFALSMWLSWGAGRAAAIATGRPWTGALAGLLTSMFSSLIWIAASVFVAARFHTDGTIAGILTTTPTYSAAATGPEIAGLVAQEIVAGLISLGLGAVAGRIGGAAARIPRSMVGGWVPPVTPAIPGPGLASGPGRPFVVAPATLHPGWSYALPGGSGMPGGPTEDSGSPPPAAGYASAPPGYPTTPLLPRYGPAPYSVPLPPTPLSASYDEAESDSH
jgi:hypothetical protein